MRSRIMLLEDDRQLHMTIKAFLEYIDYEVISAYDAMEAKEMLYEKSSDLMLLDVKVPYQNGFDLLKELREGGDTTPAIFITSLSSIDDLSRGFDVGCDDYIKKPFELKELELRVKAAINKSFGSQKGIVKIDETTEFDIENFSLKIEDKKINLKQKEAKLLSLFLKNRAKIVSYDLINSTLWDYDEEPNSKSLRTYIYNLRAYLGRDRIRTVKNRGYTFE